MSARNIDAMDMAGGEGGAPRATMRPSRRDVLFGGAMIAAGAVAYARTPRVNDMAIGEGELDKVIPFTIGSWRYQTASGLVLPPPDALAAQLYNQQLTRVYASDNEMPVMLLIAYGSSQSGMLQVHRPEICYPASGYALSRTRLVDLPVGGPRPIPAKRFTAVSQARTEQLLYWTRIGDLLPVSWAAQHMAVMENNLKGVIPDGVLVRLSTISTSPEESDALLTRFARTMVEQVGPRGRRLLIGRSYGLG